MSKVYIEWSERILYKAVIELEGVQTKEEIQALIKKDATIKDVDGLKGPISSVIANRIYDQDCVYSDSFEITSIE